jgi:pimeloyl-ACP methyl ester carboxylesterase
MVDKMNSWMESYLTIDGIRTHVTTAGKGKEIVLIHGLGGPLMWQRLVGPLAESFRVTVIDLPGFGDSNPPPFDHSPGEYAAFILHCLDALRCDEVILVGISYGGQIVVHFASCYAERVEKLVLICSTGLMTEPFIMRNDQRWALFSAIIRATVLRSEKLLCALGARSFFRVQNRPPDLCREFYRQLSANGKRKAWCAGFRNSFSDPKEFQTMLDHIESPALIVWGENDRTVPPRYAEEFCAHLKNSHVVRFPECAHSVPLEKPLELCAAISHFTSNAVPV